MKIGQNDSNFEIKATSVKYLQVFIHQSDQSGISGWKSSDVGVMRAGGLDEEGGRWGRTHHATRQIGCDMDQHATLHPP